MNFKVKSPATKHAIETINNKMNALPKTSVYKEIVNNLSYIENKGLKWLRDKTSAMEIMVTQADKGGSIIVTSPSLLERKISEKVLDESIFQRLDMVPRPSLYNTLHDHWVLGKEKRYVSNIEAERIMGVTKKNNKSTSSHFKPGTTYFEPKLKLHKMEEKDIKPGCDPPARLISCFQDGVTKRSDVFVVEKWLKSLENEFCTDLVKDSLETLRWLDYIDSSYSDDEKKGFLPFTFDFRSNPFMIRCPHK